MTYRRILSSSIGVESHLTRLSPLRFHMRRIGTDVERESGLECPVCTFLGGDGSVQLGWSSSGLALESSWQSAEIGWFLALTDEPMVTLLGFNAGHDITWMELLAHRSLARPSHNAVKSRLIVDGYVAGRVLLRTARHRLSWPCGGVSHRWRDTILAHRTHQCGSQFRSTGATHHVHRVAAQAGLVNDRLFVAAALAIFRMAFADAVTEGLLAQQELSGPDGPLH
jgi:hypothetical protein